MRVVTIKCREHQHNPMEVSFASGFEPNEATAIEDMQQHMDINFKARCNRCFGCDWEVTDVRKVLAVVNGARN